jgi:SOS-response transcriptional repressor LexA
MKGVFVMSDLSSYLRSLRGDESLRDAAKKLGISHQYLKVLESGVDQRTGLPLNVSPSTIRKVSAGYKVSYGKLLAAAGYDDKVKTAPARPAPAVGIVTVPVISAVKSGASLLAVENIVDYVHVDSRHVGDGEFFIIQSSEVSPALSIGDDVSMLLVRRQEFLEDGNTGVVIIRGERSVVRMYRRFNTSVVLYSRHVENPPELFSIDDIAICGRVVIALIQM